MATHPNWVVEVPDELDVCIAQRHFEEALVLLEKGKEYILSCKPTSPQFDDALSDIRQKVRVFCYLFGFSNNVYMRTSASIYSWCKIRYQLTFYTVNFLFLFHNSLTDVTCNVQIYSHQIYQFN